MSPNETGEGPQSPPQGQRQQEQNNRRCNLSRNLSHLHYDLRCRRQRRQNIRDSD